MIRSVYRIQRPSQFQTFLKSCQYSNTKPTFSTTAKSSSLKTQFDNDGYLVLRNALSPTESSNLRKWSDEIEQDAFMELEQLHVHNNNTNNRHNRGLHHFEEDKSTKQLRICRSERLIDSHEGLKQLLSSSSSNLPLIVSECFGEESVLYKEKLNYKYPNCGSFKPHQDAPAYPDIFKSISVAISIDESSEISGCLEIAKGRHKEGIIGKNAEGIICDDIAENIEMREPLEYEVITTEPGDIVLFDGYAPHRSGVNLTDKPRRIIYATYNPKSEGDLREKYYERKRKQMEDGRISLIFDFTGKIVSTVGK